MPQMKEILWLTYHNHNYHPEEKKNLLVWQIISTLFLKTVIATAYAQHRKGSGQCEKKK